MRSFYTICVRIFATLYEDIRPLKNEKEKGPSKLSQTQDFWDHYWGHNIQLLASLFALSPISKTSQKSFVSLTQP